MTSVRFLLLAVVLVVGMGCGMIIKPTPDPFYRAVLQENADHALALYAQAETYRKQGQFKEARAYYRRSLRQASAAASAWIGLGQCELELGKFSRAERAFQKALALRETEVAHLGLVTALILQGKKNQARSANQRILELYGESYGRLRLEGDLEFIDNQPHLALDAYRKSLSLYPQQPKIEQRVRELEVYLTSTP